MPKAFCTLLGISERTLQVQMSRDPTLVRALKSGNANRQVHNALTQTQRDTVVQLVPVPDEAIPNPQVSFTEHADALR